MPANIKPGNDSGKSIISRYTRGKFKFDIQNIDKHARQELQLEITRPKEQRRSFDQIKEDIMDAAENSTKVRLREIAFTEDFDLKEWAICPTKPLMDIIYKKEADNRSVDNFRHWYLKKIGLSWLKRVDGKHVRILKSNTKYTSNQSAINKIEES